ncbi:MAG: T9SS type A sorting domain-containing protein [Vicingaceae bacterium]|nr:T9SS type A sorting domain-containing protein [Vicingaceae bacterium]
MKKYSLLLCYGCFSFVLNAQTIFNTTYNFSQIDNATSIIKTQDNNFVVGISTQLQPNTSYILKLDALGDTLWQKKITNFVVRSLAEQTNGSLILTGVANDSTFTEGALMSLTALGDSLWKKKFGNRDANILNKVKIAPSGNIFVMGFTHSYPNPSDSTDANGWLIKTDNLGNVIYDKQFNIGKNADIFMDIHIKTDESTYVIGYTSQVSQQVSPLTGLIVHFNTNGDTLFTQQQPNTSILYAIAETSDTNFILVGTTKVNGKDKGLVTKITPQAIPIWQKSYARDTNNYDFRVVAPFNSNTYLVGGTDYDLTQNPIKKRVRFIVLNALGDSLWSQQYSHTGGNTENSLFSMTLNNNGGFVFSGNSWVFPQQNAWVVSVDSIDCVNYVNGCQTVGVEEILNLEQETLNFLLYPNPNNGSFTIRLTHPIAIGFVSEEVSIEVYDVFGKQIHYTTTNTSTEIQLDLGNVPKGFYLVSITTKKQKEIKKIVVE